MTSVDPDSASAIIDRIYEAAFLPDEWPKVLEAISGFSGSASGQIFLFSETSPVRGSTQQNLRPLFDEFVAGDTWKFSDSVQRMYAIQPASFVLVDDFMTAEEIERDPARISLRALGIGQHVCAAVPMQSGELVTFVFQRWMRDGAFDRASIDLLDGIRPHLARAGLITARLGLEQARATVSALEAIGLPAAVLRASGRVLAVNDLLDKMPDIFLPAAHGRMAIADQPANLLFREAVSLNHHHRVVRSIPVRRGEGRSAAILHVVPLRRAAHDVFSGADILVAATVPTPSAMVPAPDILGSLFDLTPAEARLAAALASGLPLRQAAARVGVGFGTARNYLIRVFRKTGTNQQGQLVALLKTAHPFPVR